MTLGREVVVGVLLRMDAQIQRWRAWSRRTSGSRSSSASEPQLAQLLRPPSSDPPSFPPRRGEGSLGRERGAQDGHEGHGRELLPAWAVDEVVEHWPERCRCGHVFGEEERVAVGEPARHQVEELPRDHGAGDRASRSASALPGLR